jgi:hypothetical protein
VNWSFRCRDCGWFVWPWKGRCVDCLLLAAHRALGLGIAILNIRRAMCETLLAGTVNSTSPDPTELGKRGE